MTTPLKIAVFTVAAMLTVGNAWARGNPETGQRAVAAFECQQCHTTDGQPGRPGIPTLAGQKAGYLVRTLLHFKFGEIRDSRSQESGDAISILRKHPVMNDLTRSMSMQTLEDIAAYYAALSCGPSDPAKREAMVEPPGVERCEICHGGKRTNPWADTPYLAGQDRRYLINQINHLWTSRSGYDGDSSRHHRLAEIMFDDDDQPNLEAFADYFSELPCRP